MLRPGRRVRRPALRARAALVVCGGGTGGHATCARAAAAPGTRPSSGAVPRAGPGAILPMLRYCSRACQRCSGVSLVQLLHALLHALLFLGVHGRIALGDAEPLGLALAAELVPLRRERREDLLLVGGERGPFGGRGPWARRARLSRRRREHSRIAASSARIIAAARPSSAMLSKPLSR